MFVRQKNHQNREIVARKKNSFFLGYVTSNLLNLSQTILAPCQRKALIFWNNPRGYVDRRDSIKETSKPSEVRQLHGLQGSDFR